jgi:hypothetical protein
MTAGGAWPLDTGPHGRILVDVRAEQEVSPPLTTAAELGRRDEELEMKYQ